MIFMSVGVKIRRFKMSIALFQMNYHYQHWHFFFSSLPSTSFKETPLPPCSSSYALYFLTLISLANFSKDYSTLFPSLALTSMKLIPYFAAIFSPSYFCTLLQLSRSHFDPISNLQTSSEELVSICLIQLLMFLKDSSLLMAQTRIIPAAPLQYV